MIKRRIFLWKFLLDRLSSANLPPRYENDDDDDGKLSTFCNQVMWIWWCRKCNAIVCANFQILQLSSGIEISDSGAAILDKCPNHYGPPLLV